MWTAEIDPSSMSASMYERSYESVVYGNAETQIKAES